jgi:hypothetical protein
MSTTQRTGASLQTETETRVASRMAVLLPRHLGTGLLLDDKNELCASSYTTANDAGLEGHACSHLLCTFERMGPLHGPCSL